jgi:tRNA ligase
MEQYTQAPYYLTLKSNGCLILISALSPTELVVASKHSLGTRIETDEPSVPAAAGADAAKEGEKQDRAHAEVGREWVRKTLRKSGRTEVELARRLWDEDLTAVLEVCLFS